MANLNEVRLIGRLTRDPSTRMTPNGQQVATFGLATNRKFRGQDGAMREETVFVEITCWARLAETVSKYMRKGKQVYVGGRLKFESWEDRQTGQKRSRLSVTADNVQFLDRRDDMSTGDYGSPQPMGDHASPQSEWEAQPAPSQSFSPVQPSASQPSTSPPSTSPLAPDQKIPAPNQPPTWEEPGMDEPPF